ncbi:MAG TPA: SprT family zinc-dependent metalloprotease [Solirubrobacteraceae bacterium]|jgi:hypothetical protein
MTHASLQDRPSRQIDVDGSAVTVRVRESARARTTRILLGPRRPLEIIVPAGTGDDEIDGLLATRRHWIAEKLAVVEAEQARPAQLGLARDGVVWLGAEAMSVEVLAAPRPLARFTGETLQVLGPTDEERLAAVGRWYRREARERIRAVAAAEARRLDLPYRSVSIRDQKTRWGSCSPAGNLSFSWRLLIAPTEVMTYVVVHELCHVAVPNHSKAFWRHLSGAFPGWEGPAGWLRQHGAELRAYSPRI